MFLVPPERFDKAARAAKLPADGPAWAQSRLSQYVMTLADDHEDAALAQACSEAARAATAVDTCAAGGRGEAASRKRRGSYLSAGGGSP
jgi:hypothetical protein